MYHAIVKRIALKNFSRVNEHDIDGLLSACDPHIRHRFGGAHALGGERHDRDALRLWFERLGRVMPTLALHAHDVWVKGWPHHTVVVIRWTSTATLPNQVAYHNHGVHIVTMRWGKAVSIDANEDSQAVAEALRVIAENGLTEAAAEPILS